MWGGNMALDLSVYLKIGPATVVVPLRLSDAQFKARARVTLCPLVDTFPCIGGVTLSLLDVPHFDFKLRLFGGPDVMAFPGVKEATRAAIAFVVTEVALYPNSVSVPLMPNYGIPEAPKGMVHVRLHRAEVSLLCSNAPCSFFYRRRGGTLPERRKKDDNGRNFNVRPCFPPPPRS
jgi:Ca2+-dependent lipid-binding protein